MPWIARPTCRDTDFVRPDLPVRVLQVVSARGLAGQRDLLGEVSALSSGLGERGHGGEVWAAERVGCAGTEPAQTNQAGADRPVPVRLFSNRGLRSALADKTKEFEVIHVHGPPDRTVTSALRAARRAGVPTVLSPVGATAAGIGGRFRRHRWQRLARGGDLDGLVGLHFTSEQRRAAFPRIESRAEQVLIAPHGVHHAGLGGGNSFGDWPFDGDWAAVEDPVAELCAGHPELLVCLAPLARRGDPELLLAALGGLPGNTHLVFAGPDRGGAALWRARIEALGLGHRVSVQSGVQGATRAALLEHAVCLVLTSAEAEAGHIALEAMAAGTPPIVSAQSPAAEWVRHGGGLVVPAEVDRWRAAIGGLLADSGRRERLARAGRELVRERALWPSVAERFERAYLGWIGGESRARVFRLRSVA